MVGITEIGAGLSGLKAALDIAKGINAAADAVAINESKIALQSAILDAQRGLLAAQEAETAKLRRIEQLEQEIMRLKDWSSERERYQLVQIYRGAVAYMPKLGMENGQPAHWLCANCFEQRRKSFLQFKEIIRNPHGPVSMYGCDACKASVSVPYNVNPTYSSDAAEPA